MAEFQKVAKEWARMCAKMQIMDGCDKCPIVRNTHNAKCTGGEMPSDIEGISEIERAVMQWSKENPEPVYPTWADWLIRQDILVITTTSLPRKYYTFDERKITEPIPADIAEKLGIQPKER